MDNHTVGQLHGHIDLNMVARYQHLSPAYWGESVARLDEVFDLPRTPESPQEPLPHPRTGGHGEAGNQGHRCDALEARADVEAPEADRIGDNDNGQQEQEIECAEPMISLRVNAARIMVLQPVGADHDVAENQREKFAPLLGHGTRQSNVAVWALGRSRHLDLDDQ
jgi:hypothetical protein